LAVKSRRIATWFLFIGSLALGNFSWLLAAGHKPAMAKPAFSSWLTYWDSLRARQALYAYGPQLEEVELFAYHFAPDDTLVPASPNFRELQDAFTQLPGPKKPRLAITIVNDLEGPQGIRLKDSGCVHRVLGTPAARDVHILQILAIADAAQSIDIDYERVAPEDGQAFTDFIQALAQALHQKGKRLSVVVEPRTGDQTGYAWKDLGQAADQLTVMAYLYHYAASDPGSIAPVDWVNEIAAYGLKQVPAEKFCIALHLGGFDWTKGSPGKSLEYDKADALAAAYGSKIELDSKSQSGHFTYSDGSKNHEVWIESPEGLLAKVERLRLSGVSHIAFWRLGTGSPVFWEHLKRI